jgi:hypothetical protein
MELAEPAGERGLRGLRRWHRRRHHHDVAASTSQKVSRLPDPVAREIHGRPMVFLDSAAPRRSRAWSSTRWTATTRPSTPTCTAASTRSPRPPTPWRPPAPGAAASSARPAGHRDRLHQERHRVAQPGGPRGAAPTSARATPSCSPTRAPRQHRAVAHAPGREGHRDPLDPTHRRRPARPHRPPRLLDGAKARSASPPCRTCSAPSPRCGAVPRGPRRRRAGDRRRLPVRAAPRHRRQALGADFLAFSGHKMLGPPASACCGAARSCSTPCRRSSAAAG